MDGIVIAIVTQQGQTVNSNQSAPTIIKLARLDVMTIKAQISEADITRISVGQKARFSIFSEPDKHYSATLRAVELAPESVMKDDSLASNTSASGSGTSNASVYYNALFDVPNPENRLRIAMTAQVTLITDEAQNTLLVPIQAVHRNEGEEATGPGAGSRWQAGTPECENWYHEQRGYSDPRRFKCRRKCRAVAAG